ncbi:MAG TPA: ABC transporter ATP-binding protein [Candidatus Limnocylindrales bacterium]|nr:ABC transporter ATP-binding protein [Candidatus Limnocylindrales bacterium]
MTSSNASPAAPGHGVAVTFEDLHRWYGTVHALDGLSIDIAPGELVALLGPSGCGKTTALRALGGLDEVNAGRILVDGRDITRVPANKRNMGIVFQAYSLFPNMTARDNVGYGLRLRGVDGASRRKRADEMLDLVGLREQANRYPHQMSGGQQQRVALARALAIQPSVLLLDEPLSALDAKVRRQLREEIRRIQIMVGITTVFVTHDQEEALAMGDRVGVMSAGRLEQIAPPAELYDRPKTRFVAEFVGLTNRVRGVAQGDHVTILGTSVPLLPGSATSGGVIGLVRPENIRLTAGAADATPGGETSAGEARVVATSFLGSVGRTQVALADGTLIVAQTAASDSAALGPGTSVTVDVVPSPVFAIEADAS